MQVSAHDWISSRAYTLWEKEGRPHGRDAEHWAQAQREFGLLETSTATKPATRRKPAAKKASSEETATDAATVTPAATPKPRIRKPAVKQTP